MKTFILLVATFVAVQCSSVDNFLQHYGYMNPNAFGGATETDAIKKFQNTFGLPETGVADDATMALMKAPRCGVTDKRNAFADYSWPDGKRNFTYSFENFTPDLTQSQITILTKQAFKFWSDVTDVLFKQVKDNGDITITFDRYYHTDNRGDCPYPFEGPGGVIAHAFYPPGGRMHFDDDERFTNGTAQGKNYLWVATHEIGHLLGLDHDTAYKDSIMQPYIRPYNPNMKLGRFDIWRIKDLYDYVCRDRMTTEKCLKYKKKYKCTGYSTGWTRKMKSDCAKTCHYCY